MCFCEKELTPGTNTHGKIHHGSRKKGHHLLALLCLSEISDGFMKTWNKTKIFAQSDLISVAFSYSVKLPLRESFL